ncbi:spindle and centriole-associated protein 1 [Stigmatopora argus]
MFARAKCRTQNGNGLKRASRPKKTVPIHKNEWVSTISDLSVHKLTPAEVSYRRESRKSHNKVVAQWEMREKALRERFRHTGGSPLDKDSQRIIREVFSEKLLLQDILARSDKTLAAVNELFGDPQGRHIGQPSVTMAPNSDSPIFRGSTEPSPCSDSFSGQQALTEPEDEYYSASDEEPAVGRPFQSKMKMLVGRSPRQRGRHAVNECTPARAPLQTALNASTVVQRLRSRHDRSEKADEESFLLLSQVLNPDISPRQTGNGHSSRSRKQGGKTAHFSDSSSVASSHGQKSSLGLMQSMLAQVERELDSLSPQTSTQGRRQPTEGLTGFSLALVSILARLVGTIKERQHDVETAIEERRKLEETLREQRGLIDALTAETMTLREETSFLQAELKQRTAQMERKLDSAVSAMATHINQRQGTHVIATVQQPVLEQPPVSIIPTIQVSSLGQGDVWRTIPEPEQSSNKLQAHNSSSNFMSQISPDSELAELRRLKDAISAQLSRVERVAKSPGASSEQRCSGSGEISQNAANDNTAACGVQQRLLELNRQSTVARERLLDLIELQKRNTCAGVSPSGSPVPPSAFSPQHSDGNPDGSPPMRPENRRSTGSQVHFRHYEEAQRDRSAQPRDKQQVHRQSWFALSAHVQ